MNTPEDSHSHQDPPGEQPQPIPRVLSGIAGLDTILHGGFLRGSTYLVDGQPGTGKTVLSNQIAFNHVAAGGRVVYVTVLTETHSRMFGHLSSMSFFRTEAIGSSLFYISGYGVAKSEGLKGLLTLLQGAIRDNHATMLVIDGVLHAEALAPSELAFKEFIHQLQVFAEHTNCTALLLSSPGEARRNTNHVAAQTITDGWIHLSRTRVGMRSAREVEVLKLRGSAFREGGHFMQITERGVEVYPRTEALLGSSSATVEEMATSRERMAFGVSRLDEMLGGGLLSRSATMLLGPPGSGKTLLGLHFIAEGAKQQQAGLYFGLNEPPPVLIDAGDQVGLDFSGLVQQGKIQLRWHPALETPLDLLAEQLLAAVKEQGAKRLFVDGTDVFSDHSIYGARLGPFLRALVNELRGLGVTTLLSVELRNLFGPTVDARMEGASAVVENIIFLRYAELRSQLYRLISILKVRRSAYEPSIREFRITNRGIQVADTFDSAEAILTELARPLTARPGSTEQAQGMPPTGPPQPQ
jgi:circadian clock protein KaiC